MGQKSLVYIAKGVTMMSPVVTPLLGQALINECPQSGEGFAMLYINYESGTYHDVNQLNLF